MLRVAVTGGPATGKSTVLRMLSTLGRTTLSSDDIVANLYNDEYIQKQVASLLGLPLPLSKTDVRKRVMSDAEARRRLNALLHPYVYDTIATTIAEFIEVPLLLEACLQSEFGSVWVVACERTEQRRRLVERLGSEFEADSILASQLPLKVKTAFADEVIRTNADIDSVMASVAAALSNELSALAT